MKELTPLTPAQQAEFDHRRQSDAVIQTKCPNCSRWWETMRLSQTFQETFLCDCGERITLEVPAAPAKLILPSNSEVLAALDPDARLDTGMKVGEAIARASVWWEKGGARLMKQELARQAKSPASADKGMGGAFASRDPDSEDFLPSGLIHGDPWEILDKREKLMVVKVWHHFMIRVPDTLGEPDAVHKIEDRGLIQ